MGQNLFLLPTIIPRPFLSSRNFDNFSFTLFFNPCPPIVKIYSHFHSLPELKQCQLLFSPPLLFLFLSFLFFYFSIRSIHLSRASQKTCMYFPKNPFARYTWRNRAKGTSSMDERSACVKADPKRIREVFKRGERIKGISRSIEIRNRTRLACLLHAKIEGKQRRKGESRGRGREKWK